MYKSWKIERRTFLRGMGVSMMLPMLDIMFLNEAQAAKSMKPRFAGLFLPTGIMGQKARMNAAGNLTGVDYARPYENGSQTAWRPTYNGALRGPLPLILQPLEPLKNKFSVISGLSSLPGERNRETSIQHSVAATMLFTAAVQKMSDYKGRLVTVPDSIDQYIANKMGITPGSTITFSPGKNGFESRGGYLGNISSNSKLSGNHLCSKMANPRTAFDSLFRSCSKVSTGSAPASLSNDDKGQINILDSVMDSIKSLDKKLGKEDKIRMESYYSHIEDLQKSISVLPDVEPGDLCPTNLPISGNDWFNTINAMIDVVALALATEFMPVATIMTNSEAYSDFKGEYYGEVIAKYGDFKGVNGKKVTFPTKTTIVHQEVAHKAKDNLAAYEHYLAYNRMQILFAKRLMEKLDGFAPEPNGNTPLDNSIVFAGACHSDGNTHSVHNLPILLAGGKKFGVKQGQHIPVPMFTGVGNLHYSIAKALGLSGVSNFNGHSNFLNQVFS